MGNGVYSSPLPKPTLTHSSSTVIEAYCWRSGLIWATMADPIFHHCPSGGSTGIPWLLYSSKLEVSHLTSNQWFQFVSWPLSFPSTTCRVTRPIRIWNTILPAFPPTPGEQQVSIWSDSFDLSFGRGSFTFGWSSLLLYPNFKVLVTSHIKVRYSSAFKIIWKNTCNTLKK